MFSPSPLFIGSIKRFKIYKQLENLQSSGLIKTAGLSRGLFDHQSQQRWEFMSVSKHQQSTPLHKTNTRYNGILQFSLQLHVYFIMP